MEKTNNQIVLKQLPIIQHRMIEVGKNVQKRIDDLNLENQIVTIDNVKAMKALSSELNKEFKEFEGQRGTIKKAIAEPYNEFEAIYKTEITERYGSAKVILKNKIDFVEDKIKQEKKDNVVAYFNELCQNEDIDFLKFEDLKMDINLSTSEKKYKEAANAFIEKTLDDLALIKTTEFEAEIMTEYKKSLNCSQAITTVTARKEAEKKEQARIKAELIQNRKTALERLGFVYETITDSLEFNDDILISQSDIESLSKEDFTEKYESFKVQINEIKQKEIEAENSKKLTVETPIETPKKVSQPIIKAPIIETPKEEQKMARFEVKATLTQLRALGDYMKANGIIYTNIKN